MTIYEKLLEVQKEIGAIKKEETNPFFKSKYFDINGLLAAVKPVLNAHGLVLTQGLGFIELNGKPALDTQITHAESGEFIKCICPLPETNDPQKAGSAVSYFRRYALQSLLALEAEDDDGEGSKPIYDVMNTKLNDIHKVIKKEASDIDDIIG